MFNFIKLLLHPSTNEYFTLISNSKIFLLKIDYF